MIERRYRNRLIGLAILMMLALVGVSTRLVYLHFHLSPGVDRGARINAMRQFRECLAVSRGKILDRNGNVLALDLVKKELCASPADIASNRNAQAVAEIIGRILNVEPCVLMDRINRPERQFVYVTGYGHVLEDNQAAALERAKLPGVFLKDAMVRSYPRGTSLCHVLGYVNLEPERNGCAGVEQRWDRYLRGVPGLLVSERDGRRHELYDRRLLEIKARPGANVMLTIDQYVQYIVERALENAMREQRAKAAWAIVERVHTGEILAMANLPAFDPHAFRATEPDIMRNNCIANNYEPGSTFKVTVVAAALNEKLVAPAQIFDCENGTWFYKRRALHDFHPYGNLSVADIIKKSSNIGAAKIAVLLGNQRLYAYLKQFGIGECTGIELPGEETGLLWPVSKWTSISPTRIAIGHEVAVTALQMLGVLCTIANDGVRMKPHIIQQVTDADGRVLYQQFPVAVSQPIRPDTARLMKSLLVRVTEEGGTGARARVEGYTVGGKTGTAQKAIPGGYSDTLNMSSFMGFIPAEDPELAIIVVLDEPSNNVRTGGYVAGPVFKEIAEQSVRYLDIAPMGNTTVADRPGVGVNRGI
ncbi:MAG: penicillin-binding protein 2 [Kiritimatiellae bacterium]|nr:penicillin-binding protein 2 [Kiritimatiellia bacterium]